ncbi:hypothetical protein Salmuc_00823 [Salipiger mucosus DSM 16094]|uniref:Sel1 repeat family protein n=1 Tax=Salipiger mucosus DSM 16094 TaxID=1123237 RepID=S9R290_9RHOB|nr:hypothetical protein Salmuc_00823 [Salipiger mucosus DSM 16094]
MLAFGLSAVEAAASPVAVDFAPPEVSVRDVCVARPTSAELEARWSDWDGALDDRPLSLVRRDLRLLRSSDAERWYDTLERAYETLEAEVESYGPNDHALARIDLLVAAGRYEELRASGLFDRLTTLADGGNRGAMVTAAELIEGGEVVEEDSDRALAYWRRAAYAGHPSALLEMAGRSAEGARIEDWTIAPDIAVTMGFGAIVGDIGRHHLRPGQPHRHTLPQGGRGAAGPGAGPKAGIAWRRSSAALTARGTWPSFTRRPRASAATWR